MDFLFYRAADGEDSVPDFSGRVFMRVIFPLTRTGNTLGWAEYNFTLLTLPSFQEKSTVTFPRAYSPFTEPSGHASTGEGMMSRPPVWDCTNISQMPPTMPKLPSICIGG